MTLGETPTTLQANQLLKKNANRVLNEKAFFAHSNVQGNETKNNFQSTIRAGKIS